MNNLLGTKTGREAVRYWYDEAGRVSAMQTGITELNANAAIPQNGSVTRYTYNNLGYLISETDALNNSKSFTYDYVGNIKTSTDRNGAVTTNVYGPYGVISTSITNGTDTEEYTYTYNGFGKLKETKLYKNGVVKDIITSEYDGFGRKVSETSNGYTNTYEYDNNSSLTNYKLKDGSTVKETINYVYNNMNRLTEQKVNDTIISYGYDFNGNLTEKVIGNLRTDISYNSFNEPVEYTNKYGETILNSYEYTYNSAENRLTETDSANNIHKTYEYDNADRLVKEAIGGAIEKESTYIYDSNGNRMTEDTEYEQDLFSEESESFSYNLQNQLVQYTKGDTTVSYEYGANGLRKSKTVNGVTTGYVWNGANLVAETDGEAITSIYSYGVDGITLKTTGETESYYLKNAHGDVTAMATESGEITAEYVYDSFGNILTNTPNDTNPFRYCGEYTDHESGLIYLRNRYYNPTLGRFITEDPAKDDMNWYVYCGNNPVMFVDPTGESVKSIIFNESGQKLMWFLGAEKYLKSKQYYTSSWMLVHSLKNNPEDVWRGNDSRIAYLINNDSEYLSKLDEAIKSSINGKIDEDLKCVMFKTGDLYYSIHKATIHVNGYLQDNGTWLIHAEMTDTYDFTEIQTFMDDNGGFSIQAGIGTIANDAAAVSQWIGSINPYKITVEFYTTR